MWGLRGNRADDLLKDFRRTLRDQENVWFSEPPQKLPPNIAQPKCNQTFGSVAFPLIHIAHHNKKSIFILKNIFVEFVVIVEKVLV